MGMESQAGFLIVKTFHRLYNDYAKLYGLTSDLYAIPRINKEPGEYAIQYRGLDRDALFPIGKPTRLWRTIRGSSYSPAEVRLGELEAG